MTQLLKGVHYLHKNKVIHRDLKLGNIFLNDDMEVKIGEMNSRLFTEMYRNNVESAGEYICVYLNNDVYKL